VPAGGLRPVTGRLRSGRPDNRASDVPLATAQARDILDVMRGASLMPEDLPVPAAAEHLSPGELRVLRYLPTNLSRPEIAAELSVSVNTVSTHIRSIYAKLGADDRSAVIRRARELRLLAAARS
jgi:LuxR family maltose regulon positive regulatory protein